MDIQKMVDDRIEELSFRKRNISATPVLTEVDDRFQAGDAGPQQDRRRHGSEAPEYDTDRRPRLQRQHQEVPGLQELLDGSLTEVAERVLAITERVAGDYTRMEKDILDSRLALLQSAEEVLDIAISLRRKAKQLLSAPVMEIREYGEEARRF